MFLICVLTEDSSYKHLKIKPIKPLLQNSLCYQFISVPCTSCQNMVKYMKQICLSVTFNQRTVKVQPFHQKSKFFFSLGKYVFKLKTFQSFKCKAMFCCYLPFLGRSPMCWQPRCEFIYLIERLCLSIQCCWMFVEMTAIVAQLYLIRFKHNKCIFTHIVPGERGKNWPLCWGKKNSQRTQRLLRTSKSD